MNLRETQALFWRLITAPRGVDAALAAEPALRAPLEATFAGDAAFPAADRVDVYANMYFWRLLDVLREDFPKLRAALGETHFHNLATDYVLACPSTHPSLRYFGARLPAFVEGHAVSTRAPWAGALGRLEWARIDAFDAPDAAGRATARALMALAPEAWPGLRLRFVPSLEVLALAWPAHRTWLALEEREAEAADATGGAEAADPERSPEAAHLAGSHGREAVCAGHAPEGAPAEGLPALERADTAVRVWRDGWDVFHAAMAPDQAAALACFRAGGTLADVCERLAAARAAELLRRWLDDGLVEAVEGGVG